VDVDFHTLHLEVASAAVHTIAIVTVVFLVLGVAFKDDDLKKGELFPAVAPIYSGDSYTIKRPTPED
jgi:hypothetical protein